MRPESKARDRGRRAASRERRPVERALEPCAGSFAENANTANVLVVDASGAESMVVSGAVTSGGGTIDHWRTAGLASVFPAASVVRTSNRCSPSARPATVVGELQAENAAPSSEHSNVEPASFAEKAKLASVLAVSAGGPEAISVSGGVTSGGGTTVHA